MEHVRRGAGNLLLRALVRALVRAFGALALLCALAAPEPALAQPASASGDDGDDVRIALLDVPGGGVERLAEEMDALQGVEVRDQRWFVSELKSRGVATKNVMKRPKDLRWVMEGAEIDYIVYLEAADDEAYGGKMVGSSGEIVRSFRVARFGEALTEANVRVVMREVREELGLTDSDGGSEWVGVLEEVPADASSDSPKRAEIGAADEAGGVHDAKEVDDAAAGEPWLWGRGSFRLLKRDMIATGAGAVLTYESGFYPGFGANLQAYPGVVLSPDYADIGMYLDFLMGFDSVAVSSQDGQSRQRLPITHVEVEGGAIYRVGHRSGPEYARAGAEATSPGGPQGSIRATLRHSRFTLDPNVSLPSLSTTSIVAAGRLVYPFLTPGLAAKVDMEFTPVGFQADGAGLFGRSSYTYGVGAGLGALYQITAELGVELAYQLRFLRADFEGQGELEFADSELVELVQGLQVGLVYRP